ncbi:MAG: DUF4282 domain-containing protein [Chromatiales bacterium]|nr:DUF4282 domain-containing protein [Chromatiales bacterium]
MLSDVATFRVMIGEPLLFVVYYVGAVVLPVLTFMFVRWATRREPARVPVGARSAAHAAAEKAPRPALVVTLFIVFFTIGELVWRLMFEILIAYFQIHAVLTAAH